MKKNNGGDMAFNGQDNSTKPEKYLSKYQTNASGRTAKENYGRGPTTVGRGSTGVSGKTPATTAKGGKINGGATVGTTPVNVGRGPTKGVGQ